MLINFSDKFCSQIFNQVSVLGSAAFYIPQIFFLEKSLLQAKVILKCL